jgi:rod shape-determining protein MreB
VTAGEVHTVAVPIIRKIAEEVRSTLAALQPEVAADIFDRGIILTGGGASLTGLQQYLHAETGLVVRMADEPRLAIVRGLAQLFDEPLLLRRVARNEPHPLLDADQSAFES